MRLLTFIDFAFFAIVAFFISYDLFFVIASFFKRKATSAQNKKTQRFAVVFAAYKEDRVILDSVENFLRQDYPIDKYQVVVVSDHMREETNQALAKLPINLMIPDFEQSMKHKSITYALDRLEGFDRIVILDADNLVEKDFLKQINDNTQSGIVLQAHRTRKNANTSVAIWDGISEEINNTIYRKGRVNMGVSSALIGSGMVFDFEWLKENMRKCETFAEDKELEVFLAAENIFVDYTDDIHVYDEKTSWQEVLIRQRSRWFHAQILAFSIINHHFNRQSLNWNYIDKMIQWIPFPRVLKLLTIFLVILVESFVAFSFAIKWYILLLIGILTYLLAIPKEMYTRDFGYSTLKFPFLFVGLIKSYIMSLYRIKNKDISFQSTPHDIESKKQDHG